MRRIFPLVLLLACSPEPRKLSATGLYEARVVEYSPQFPLWSDGMEKTRWILLPQGEAIDTSDMNDWRFPVGTKLWKEFSKDGAPVETRLLHKAGPEERDWTRTTYQWKEDGSEAIRIKAKKNVDCGSCHDNVGGGVLGFSAVQLPHETLAELVDDGALSDPPDLFPSVPGDAVAQAALGTLHANCGSCHNPASNVDWVDLQLHLDVHLMADVESTPTYQTAVIVPSGVDPIEDLGVDCLIRPGMPEESLVWLRMNERDAEWSMPPLGSDRVDRTGADVVAEWITSLQ